jgi:hypothetical protein
VSQLFCGVNEAARTRERPDDYVACHASVCVRASTNSYTGAVDFRGVRPLSPLLDAQLPGGSDPAGIEPGTN